MLTYIILGRYTQKGIENMKESPARLEKVKAASAAAGGALKAFYLTLGHYDFVSVVETPSDEAAAKVLLSIGAMGAVRTETLRAFTEEEYKKIVAGLL